MSRIGKMPIAVPKGAEVKLAADSITVKGPPRTPPPVPARHFAIEAADLSLLTDVGQLLSNLHQTSAPHPVQRHTAHDIDALQQACTTLAYLQPDLADEVRTLCARTTLALQQGIWQPRITHGDMSLEQLVRNDLGQILIIDWDSAAWGDPMADFGSLLARLGGQHLQGRGHLADLLR